MDSPSAYKAIYCFHIFNPQFAAKNAAIGDKYAKFRFVVVEGLPQ
jgi:hypothetical protein